MNIPTVACSNFAGWNQEVFTENDFYNEISKNGIIYRETDLIESAGCYLIFESRSFILVNSDCSPKLKQWVQVHELAHHYLGHQPCGFSSLQHRKLDWEANIIASVALIPMWVLERYSTKEIIFSYGYLPELVECRLEVYVKLKI